MSTWHWCVYVCTETTEKTFEINIIANSTDLTHFIDASKGCDGSWIKHDKLLIYCTKVGSLQFWWVLVLWYADQTTRVKWGTSASTPLHCWDGWSVSAAKWMLQDVWLVLLLLTTLWIQMIWWFSVHTVLVFNSYTLSEDFYSVV